MNFPIAFPSNVFRFKVTSYDNGGGKIVASISRNMTMTGFLLARMLLDGNYNFRWFAQGDEYE